MPKQNRPLVRDGRLQAPKKRTDRSYLGTPAPPTVDPAAPAPDPNADPVSAFEAAAPAVAAEPAPVAPVAAAPAVARPAAAPPQSAPRRRRDVDPEELLAQDSSYAMHELRRIGVLAVVIMATLIGLGIFMR